MTQKDMLRQIKAMGLSARMTGCGKEIRIAYFAPKGGTLESSAYYTEDRLDAIGTAQRMAAAKP